MKIKYIRIAYLDIKYQVQGVSFTFWRHWSWACIIKFYAFMFAQPFDRGRCKTFALSNMFCSWNLQTTIIYHMTQLSTKRNFLLITLIPKLLSIPFYQTK